MIEELGFQILRTIRFSLRREVTKRKFDLGRSNTYQIIV